MIVSAFSTLGLTGNKSSPFKPWYFDFEAFNHLTNTTSPPTNVKNYTRDLNIHKVGSNSLPVTIVGDGSSKLANVFVSPTLSTNLIFVGQLVQINDWNVNFSCDGCMVQDQVSKKMVAKDPKMG